MKWVFLLLLGLSGFAHAQTREVFPGELDLHIKIEETVADPFVGELVLVTIEGTYRRHITLEKLLQPQLDGFSWSQLGQDAWFERTENGLKVKGFRRRMALFPDISGTLTIPAFTHRLTLLDEQNKWFEHDIRSAPIEVQVSPKPDVEGWWLPVKRLVVNDSWSNAPDQLQAGEGVLRIIRVQATGISPDYMPPMPELKSPSALIFPHPEQRLVELSPEGPISIAYWRWTIQPHAPPSAILEPLEIDYYDTTHRKFRRAEISAQRVAYSDSEFTPSSDPLTEGVNRSWMMGSVLLLSAVLGVVALGWGRGVLDWTSIKRRLGVDRDQLALSKAIREEDLAGIRRAAHALVGEKPSADLILREFDLSVFSAEPGKLDLHGFRREVLALL